MSWYSPVTQNLYSLPDCLFGFLEGSSYLQAMWQGSHWVADSAIQQQYLSLPRPRTPGAGIQSVTVSYNSYISLFAYRIHRLVILIPKDLHSTVIRNEDHSPKSKTLRPLLNVAYNYKLYIGLLYWYKKIYNSHTKWISQDHDPKSKTLRPLLNFT